MSCSGSGDFVLAHASGKKCELVILLHSRVLIRDQMARRELLLRRCSETRRQSVLGCRLTVEYFLLLMQY